MRFSLPLLLPASSSAYAQVPFVQDTIAYNDLFNNRQSVVFDGKGFLHCAWSGQVGTNSASREIYYATVAGDTVTSIPVTANSVDDNYPTIAVDGADGVHIGFLGRDANNLFQVQYCRIENGVPTAPVYITAGGLNKATPWCVVGPDSVVHFLYYTFTTGPDTAYYRSYDLRTSSLSPEQALTYAEVTGDFDGSLAVDTSGNVHCVVKSGGVSGGPLRYFTDRSGEITEVATGIAVDVDYPRVLVDHANTVHILYRNSPEEVLYLTNDASGSFGTPVAITPPGQRPSTYHSFACDAMNRVYVVYQSSVATSGKGFYLIHGRDGVFSDTLRLFELSPDYILRNTSAVAARGDGEIALTYAPSASRGGSVVCDIFLQHGIITTTGVTAAPHRPAFATLSQNFPNPFNPDTHIVYTTQAAGPRLAQDLRPSREEGYLAG